MPITYDPSGDEGLCSVAMPVAVYLYGDTATTLLHNVVCESIEFKAGPHPPVAEFSYLLDSAAAADGYPTDFSQIWGLGVSGKGVVKPDDRIIVAVFAPDGSKHIFFDGFVQVPQVDVHPNRQSVRFVAVGTAIRCYDLPIGGRYMRPADDYDNYELANVISTDLPTRFNPTVHDKVRVPNCTPKDKDVNQGTSKAYPIFTDEYLGDRIPDKRTQWTLPGAIAYIMSNWNNEKYIKNPDFSKLKTKLQSRQPKTGQVTYDPSNSSTYVTKDIILRDYDATNMPWPEAVSQLLEYCGFGMAWTTGTSCDGSPENGMTIFRTDAAVDDKPLELALAPVGSALKPLDNVVESMSLVADYNQIANAWSIETALRRWEVSIVLAPGFAPQAGDETASNKTQFKKANLSTASGAVRKKYRWYIADETGDGHWDIASSTWVTDACDFSPLWPDDKDGNKTYCVRRRVGSQRLLSKDSLNAPMRCQLALSRDYTGPAPSVWDHTGTWQPVTGGWRLMEDRLGIYVDVDDPNAWDIGHYTGPNPQQQGRVLRGIKSLSNPAGQDTPFYLRLTTVIDDDFMVPAVVPSRPSSPTLYERRRRADARDHFRLDQVMAKSLYNPGTKDLQIRDDLDAAETYAYQLRAAHEFPKVAGSITIPFISRAYEIGRRVGKISGRNVSLRANDGSAVGEGTVYPYITGIKWSFADRQSTTLYLTDLRAEPQRA